MNNVCTGHPLIFPTMCRDGARMHPEQVFQSDLARPTMPAAWEQFYGRTSQQPNPRSFGQAYNCFGPPGSRLQSSVPECGMWPPLPDNARLMSGSALPGNDRWSTSVLARSERCPTLPGEDLSRYGGALPMHYSALPLDSSALPVNGGALPENDRAQQVPEDCPNGARWMNGSALPMNGSALPRNGNALSLYDIARHRESALPINGLRSYMLGTALPRRDNYASRGQSPVFDQSGRVCIGNVHQDQ